MNAASGERETEGAAQPTGPSRLSLDHWRQRSQRIRILRRALPAAIGLLVMLLLGWVGVRAVLTALNTASGAAGTVHMSNARFHGRDGHDRSFVLVAREASRNGANPNRVELVAPDLQLANDAGPAPRRFRGDHGIYLDDRKMLYMDGHVVFEDGGGNRFTSARAEIDIQQNAIRGDTAVTGDGPMGHVDAQTYSVDSKGDHVVFVGNVHTHLVNQQEQR
jgi:lipopolysaccharide export system protein LptC